MTRGVCVAVAIAAAAVGVGAGQARPATKILTQDQLFSRTTVWTAELTLAPDQWETIRPKQGRPTGRSRFTGGEWLQGATGERNGWSATRGIHFDYGHADLVFDGVAFRDVAVRVKGNGTYSGSFDNAKVSFKIDLNKYVKGQKIAGVSTLNFHNAIQDPGFMTESLAMRLYRDAGVPAPRTAYVRVYVTVKGQFARRYNGLYQLMENVDNNFLEARFNTAAGPLLKPVSVTPFSDLGETWNDRYTQAFDPKDELSLAEQKRVIEFCKLVQHASDAEFNARVGSFVDVDAFARYMAVVMWIDNYDSILRNGQNYYVWMPSATGKMVFFPWDQDSSFGQFFQQQPGSAEIGDIYRFPDRVKFLDRMMALPAFSAAYLRHMRALNDTVFTPQRFPPQIAELEAVTRPLMREEPRLMDAPNTGRGNLQLYDERVSGRVGVLPFINARWKNVQEQLASTPLRPDSGSPVVRRP